MLLFIALSFDKKLLFCLYDNEIDQIPSVRFQIDTLSRGWRIGLDSHGGILRNWVATCVGIRTYSDFVPLYNSAFMSSRAAITGLRDVFRASRSWALFWVTGVMASTPLGVKLLDK
jgi:hypothetical protein